MNRRQFLSAIAVATAAPGFSQTPQSAPESSNSTLQKTRLTRTPLVLMAPGPDGFEAVWAVNQLSKGRLEWECDSAAPKSGVIAADKFGFVPQSDDVLRIRVEGFTPGTTYRVRSVTTAAAGGQEETSAWKTLRTLAPHANSSRFVVWNDTHINNESIQKLHELT